MGGERGEEEGDQGVWSGPHEVRAGIQEEGESRALSALAHGAGQSLAINLTIHHSRIKPMSCSGSLELLRCFAKSQGAMDGGCEAVAFLRYAQCRRGPMIPSVS